MKLMKRLRRLFVCLVCLCVVMSAQGCGSIAGVSSGKRIIRISHAQSETHPEHLGLLKFKEYVEENLGDKYEVQIYPNEILGSAQKAIELTQTGAIDFVSGREQPNSKHLLMCMRFSVCHTYLHQKKLTMKP